MQKSFSFKHAFIKEIWPSCKAPIVGTNPVDFCFFFQFFKMGCIAFSVLMSIILVKIQIALLLRQYSIKNRNFAPNFG